MSDQSIRDHLRNMTDEERNAHEAEVVKTMRSIEAAERAVIEAALAWRSDNSFAAQNALFAAADALRKAREGRFPLTPPAEPR